jgi:hypothetical protein
VHFIGVFHPILKPEKMLLQNGTQIKQQFSASAVSTVSLNSIRQMGV